MEKYMSEALDEAYIGINNNEGGPFGAIIVKDGNIIGRGHNTVLKTNDPTAHAEINAIRMASSDLKTEDLSGAILYTTGYPCPMCLSALVWSNIEDIHYLNTKEEIADIGFRDDFIYKLLNEPTKDLNFTKIDDKLGESLLSSYNGKIY